MIASTQITNTEIFSFIFVLGFKLLSRKYLFINRKGNGNLKSRLVFKKVPGFTGKLLQNHKWLECKIIRILLKRVSDHLSVLSKFA